MARGKTPEPPKSTDQDTERLVLVRLVISGDVPGTDGLAQPDGQEVIAWVPVPGEDGEPRVFKGTKRGVIEAFAGKDDFDARPGEYRAPTLRSWRGVRKIVLPDRPRPEALWEDS